MKDYLDPLWGALEEKIIEVEISVLKSEDLVALRGRTSLLTELCQPLLRVKFVPEQLFTLLTYFFFCLIVIPNLRSILSFDQKQY